MSLVNRILALGAASLLGLSSLGTAAAVTRASSHPADADGHARALAEAKALLAEAPTLSGATQVDDPPLQRLKHPPTTTGITSTVVRAAYWTVNENAKKAYDELTATVPDGLVQDGSGSEGGSRPTDTSYEAFDLPKVLPTGLYDAELDIEVVYTSKTTAAIGIYGQAAPSVPKPPAETVPGSVHRAHVELDHPNGTVTRANTVSGDLGAQLIAAFNALPVTPAGSVRHCPVERPGAAREVVTFHVDDNVIVATPGECYSVHVVRDGQALRRLDDSPAFEKAFRAALALPPTMGAGHHPKRPRSEFVPTSVHTAYLVHRERPETTPTKRVTVTGDAARTLVRAFNHMRTEPTNSLHCDIAGGPEDIVTFRTAHHTWRVTEAVCSNITVTRDGKYLPTLLTNHAWEKALKHDLTN